MAGTHVINALTKKKAEYEGMIELYYNKIETLSDEINALNQSIKIFDPDYDFSLIKPKKIYQRSKYFQRGEVANLILEILKASDEPINGSKIVDLIKVEKGVSSTTSREERNAFEQKVSNAMHNLKRDNILEVVRRVGRDSYWRIKPISLD